MRFSVIIFCFILAGCATRIKNIEKNYQPVILAEAETISAAKKAANKLIVTVKVNDESGFKNKDFNPSLTAYQAFENILGNKRHIIIKAAADAGKTADTVKTDYTIDVKITSLNFTRKYLSRTGAKISYAFARLGAILTASALTGGSASAEEDFNPISGEYHYTAVLTGSITIIDNLSKEKITYFNLKKKVKSRESVDEINLKNLPQEFNPEMLRKAVAKAIKMYKKDILKNLPAIAYIAGRADDKHKNIIFKATFGKVDGVSAGDKVILRRTIKETNPFNNKIMESNEEISLGIIVANGLTDHFCWIKPDHHSLAKSIKMGEKVIIKFKK